MFLLCPGLYTWGIITHMVLSIMGVLITHPLLNRLIIRLYYKYHHIIRLEISFINHDNNTLLPEKERNIPVL